ncbi:MAG: hypothetical protein MUC36_19490 [Planctomycetes bacterium]|jgi:hypothetical protein|nr:hypothetical protein [Planctomycetota bacterium]
MSSNAVHSGIPERYLQVEAFPDPETNEAERGEVERIVKLLQDAEPRTAIRTSDFWTNAGNLARSLRDKLDNTQLGDGVQVDLGTVHVHALDPRNPKIYLPDTERGLPRLKVPVTWNDASPNSRHYLGIRFVEDHGETE